jgi:uncharacterized protein
MEYLSYIVKVSGECNLKCDYCYYFANSEYKQASNLSWDLIRKLITEASSLSDFVEFIWHGGEPLTAGIETFQKIIHLQKDISGNKGTKYKNIIQTNGTLLNAEWVDFIAGNDMGVGISIDGPVWPHDKHRVYEDFSGSLSDVSGGVKLLTEKGIRKGALAVVTKDSLGFEKEIFDFFIENDILSFDFLPFFDGDYPFTLAKGDYSNFIIKVFDLWLEKDDPSIKIRYIDNVVTGILGGRQSLCKFAHSCHTYISINFNGDIFPCDKYLGLEDFFLGNLAHDSLPEIVNGVKMRNFVKKINALHDNCSKCSIWEICGGACTYYQMSDEKSEQRRYCYENKIAINYIRNKLFQEHPQLITIYQASPQSIANKGVFDET